MQYNGIWQHSIFGRLAMISLPFSILDGKISHSDWPILTLFTICILLVFVFESRKYTLVIDETITYTIQIFGLTVHRKEITPSNIKKMVFKRVHWRSKLAVIQLDKGFSIRVDRFQPENVYDHLITFCEENTIQYDKSRDYKIVEKMK